MGRERASYTWKHLKHPTRAASSRRRNLTLYREREEPEKRTRKTTLQQILTRRAEFQLVAPSPEEEETQGRGKRAEAASLNS
jgi:hypothetical protein